MRWTWVALVAGAVALATGVTLLVTAHHLPTAFSAPTPAASALPVTASSTAATPAPAAPGPSPFRPTSVTLSAFGVTAPVDPVFTTGGVLDPPDDVGRVGWWAAGALAGAAIGSTVVVGHVDGPSGPGALYRLVHARAGDRITVAGSGGTAQTYAVTSLQYLGKGHALPASLFAATGPARLVVISCGGPFDRADDQYEDNVVVQAAPV